jgi:phosphate transport system substrate-binding protein
MKLNRIGSLLMVCALAAAIFAPQAAMAASIKMSGSTTVQPLAQQFAAAYHKKNPSVVLTVAGGGSSVGFTDVLNGNVAIGMSSREPKAGSESTLKKYRVAKDGLAIVVNPGNPVRKLTKAQIKGIYTGTIKNWKQVGGPNATIIPMGRTGASGTYSYFKETLLDGSKQTSRTKQYASNGMVRSGVARTKYGVGYVSVAIVNSSVRAVSVGGVAPTKSNCSSGKYPYVRPLYFLTKGTPSATVKAFISWCTGSSGQIIAMKEYLHR